MVKKVKNILSYSLVASLVLLSGASVGAYYIASSKSNDLNHNNVEYNNKPSTENYEKGVLDDAIDNVAQPQEFYELTSNKYFKLIGLNSSLKDFNNFISNSKDKLESEIKNQLPDFKVTNFYLDIYQYVKNIYLSSNSTLTIFVTNSNFSYNEQTNKISFNYEFQFENKTKKTNFFKIKENIFYLKPNEVKTFKIYANDVAFNYVLNTDGKNNYLGWSSSINFEYDGKTLSYDNFSFTTNTYSNAIPFKVIGLKNENNYLNVISQNDYYKNINKNFLLNKTENYISQNTDTALSLIGDIKDIVSVIGTNPTANELLEKSAQNILNILFKLTNFSQDYNDLFLTLIKSNKPIIEIVSENKKVLADLIVSFVNDPTINNEVIENFLDPIDFNKSDNQLQEIATQFKELLTFFVGSYNVSIDVDFINGLIDKIFDKNTTIMSLLDYYLNQKKDDILAALNTEKNTSLDFLISIVGLLVSNNGNEKILTQLTTDDGKQYLNSLINVVLSTTNPVQDTSNDSSLLSNLLSQIINKDNTDLNDTNLQNLINNIFVKLLDYFSNSENYEIIKGFDSFSYENKKISYSYTIDIVFKNEISFDIGPILDILPTNVSLGSVSIPKSFLKSFLVQDGKNLEIKIGDGDKLTFNFSANNKDIYLTPQKQNSSYIAAYSIPYELKMTLNMPHMFNSITTFYPTGGLHIVNNEIFKVLTEFMQKLLLRDYYFVGNVVISDETTMVENYNPNLYIENNTFSWLKPDSSFFTQLKDNIELKTVNTTTLEKRVSKLFGNEKIEKFNLDGLQPTFKTVDVKSDILKNTISYQSDIEPEIWVDPTLFTTIDLNIAGLINLGKIELNEIKIFVWFPYKVLNLTDSENPKLENEFSVTLTL